MRRFFTGRSCRGTITVLLVALAVGQTIALQRHQGPTTTATWSSVGRTTSAVAAFEPNLGQTDPRARFVMRQGASRLFLTAGGSNVMVLGRTSPTTSGPGEHTAAGASAAVRLTPLGANPAAVGVGSWRVVGAANYLIGDEPAGWTVDVPRYDAVRYDGIYPGIDLVYRSHAEGLEYDFVVGPGADANAIALRFEGQDRLEVAANGALEVHTPAGVVTHRRPVLYQEEDGQRHLVTGRYLLRDPATVSFVVGSHDPTRPLVIDPVVFSTFLGGSGTEYGNAIAVDALDNTFVAGSTASVDFPTTVGALRPACPAPCAGRTAAFVTKLDPQGALVYSTYLGGGDGMSAATGIAVDGAGRAHVGGETTSTSFPTVNAAQPSNGAAAGRATADAFLAKLDPAGAALVSSTYLGGYENDAARAVTLDGSGSAFLVGETRSANFPLTAGAVTLPPTTCVPNNPFELCRADGFLARFDPTGALAYATTVGGATGDDFGLAVAADELQNAYVTGKTVSTDFPTRTPIQPDNAGGFDVFVSKVDTSAVQGEDPLVYSTYLGGSSLDEATGVALDASGNAYIAGSGAEFPLVRALPGHEAVGFLAKVSTSGTSLVYSTKVGNGGAPLTRLFSVAVDGAGSAHVTGSTEDPNFPVAQAVQAGYGGGSTDAFVARVDDDGTALSLPFATLLGGGGSDVGSAIAVGRTGIVHVTGYTTSVDFPVANAAQGARGGTDAADAFVVRLQGPTSATTTTTTTSSTTTSTTSTSTTSTTSTSTTSTSTTTPTGTTSTTTPTSTTTGARSTTTTTTRPSSVVTTTPAADATSGLGYTLVASDGGVFPFGDARFLGSTGSIRLSRPVVGLERTATGNGYWLVAADGGVFAFGDARFYGSTGGIRLAQPIVGLEGTPSGNGYWMVAADGGVFAFGDARFEGSTGGMRLNAPIVGMSRTASGNGYWLVGTDGGVFAFGDARFLGSTGGIRLSKPVVGLGSSPSGNGYWMVASDGGVFAFGDARFHGSTGAIRLNAPIVGMAATANGDGYWLCARDGGVFAFAAAFRGSMGGSTLNAPMVGCA